MEVLIGRDSKTEKLKLSSGGKTVVWGTERLPDTVLEEHIKLTFEDNLIRLKNLNINVYTYVNGLAVESKIINRQQTIEMGQSHFVLDWHALDEIIPPEADIHPLQSVWEEYENQNLALQIAERKFNTLRSITGLITMAAIALSIATGGKSQWYILLYGIAIVASLAFFVKAYIDSSKMPQKRQELSRQFQRDYTCPHCGRFLGNQSYDLLAQNDHCPYCKTKFIH